MSDIPKSRRSKSSLEAYHKSIQLRRRLAMELLGSFAFSHKELKSMIDKNVKHVNDLDRRTNILDGISNLEEGFSIWFIKRHRDRVDDLCCEISQHIRAANTIWPTYKFEFDDRRNEWNQALKACNILQDELQYISESIPADKNRYMNIVLDVDELFNIIKSLRQSDNRFLKYLKD